MRCPICKSDTFVVLKKEQNVSCGDYFEGRRIFLNNIGAIDLLECRECGFAFFPEFYGWDDKAFLQNIYNEDYHLCDTPFLEERPQKIARWLASIIGEQALLDYGGGKGRLAEILRECDKNAESYDPFYASNRLGDKKFDIVTAFEVVEHVPDQIELFKTLKSLCVKDGMILFSTLLKPRYLKDDWWYASPRNGHLSFHTKESLQLLCNQSGLYLKSLSDEIHIAGFMAETLNCESVWGSLQINDDIKYRYSVLWSRLDEISKS